MAQKRKQTQAQDAEQLEAEAAEEQELAAAREKFGAAAAPAGVAEKTPVVGAASTRKRTPTVSRKTGDYVLEQHAKAAKRIEALIRPFSAPRADAYRDIMKTALVAIEDKLKGATLTAAPARKTGPLEVGESVVFSALGKQRLAADCSEAELSATYTVVAIGEKRTRISTPDGLVLMVASTNIRRADLPGETATDDLDLDTVLGSEDES